jgi:anaphase-promoting complex subunit 2
LAVFTVLSDVIRHPGHEIDVSSQWTFPNRWQPDPVEADPLKGSRNQRKVDILGMIVGIIGSKDQLVHEYRTMLAEKLLNKSDYDIDSEIRTLELLKVRVAFLFYWIC